MDLGANVRNNIGWLLIGVLSGLLGWSAGYNWYQSVRYDQMIKQIESVTFDQDVCIRRVQELTSHEREPKK
jgi:predicted negative regulator of RcsB-dependent stress response